MFGWGSFEYMFILTIIGLVLILIGFGFIILARRSIKKDGGDRRSSMLLVIGALFAIIGYIVGRLINIIF